MTINSNEQVLYCEDSIEGVFTAIYDTYLRKLNHNKVKIYTRNNCINYSFFQEYDETYPDINKTEKVSRTILREFGTECYMEICKALASYSENKADSIYHMIVHGLSSSNKRNLINDLANQYVNEVFYMAREVNNEIMHLKGFLRFEELNSGILFSKISPKNNIVTFLAPHFADRLPGENFVIYDVLRQLFILHPANKNWTLVTGEYLNEESIREKSEDEKKYRDLFTFFCKSIAIKERKNIKLQTQMLPLRFQKYMTEFK